MLLFAFSRAQLRIICLVIIVICNENQTSYPYKQNYVETSRYFYRKLYYLFSNAGKTVNMPEFEFDKF